MQAHEIIFSLMYWQISHPCPDCSDGGATLFLAGADHGRCEKEKWTRQYLLGHRRILKKGRLYHTLRKSIFSKRKTAAWFHFKPPLGHLYFDEPARTQSPIQRFFYMPLGDLPAKSLSNRLNWTLSHFVSNVLKYSKIFLLSCTIPFFSQVWWNNCISSSFLLLTI